MKSNLPQLNISRVTGRSGLTALTWPHKKGTKIGVFIRYASVWADGLENKMKELCQWPDVFFHKHHHEHIWKKLKTFTSYALHRNWVNRWNSKLCKPEILRNNHRLWSCLQCASKPKRKLISKTWTESDEFTVRRQNFQQQTSRWWLALQWRRHGASVWQVT